MGAAIKTGIGLAVIIEVITLVWFVTGLIENPMMGLVFLPIAIVLNVLAVWWALKQTRLVHGYGKQLLSAIVLGVVAGVLIFAFSWVNYNVLFPDALEDQKAATIEWMEGMGWPEEQKAAQVAKVEELTVTSQAVQALVGTILTSLVVGAIVAIFVRKKT
jgi:hypothetical protein